MKLLFTITAFLTCLVLHFGLCRALALELDLENDVQQTEISVDYDGDSTTTTTTTTITIDINSTTSDQSISSQPSFSSSSSSSSSPNELDSDDYDFEDEKSSSSSSSSAADYLQALSSALRNRLNSSTTSVELDLEEELKDLEDLDLDDVKDEEENDVQNSEQNDEQKFEPEVIVVDAEADADQAVQNSTGSVEASAANSSNNIIIITQVNNSSQPIAFISNSTDQTLLHQATANSAKVQNSTTAGTLSATDNNNNNNDTSSSSNNTDKLPTEHTGNSEAPPVQQQPIENQSSNSNNENNNSPLYGGLPKETFEWLEKYARPGSAGARIESYQEFQKAFYEKVGMADDRKDEVEGEDESDRRFRLAVALHHSPDTTTTTTPPLPQPSFPSSSSLSVDQGRQHRPELLIKTGSNDSNNAISSQLAVRRIIVRRSSEDKDHPKNPLNSSTTTSHNSTELPSPFSPPPLKTSSPFNASTAEPRAPAHRGLFTPSKPFLLGLSLGGSGTGSGSTAEQEKNSPPLLEALLQTIQSTLPSIKLSSPNSLSLPGRLAATLQKLKTALVEKKKLGPLIEYFNRLTEGVGSSLMSSFGGKFSPSKRQQQQQRPQQQKLSQQRPPPQTPQTQQPQPKPQQPKPRPARPSPPPKQTPVLPPPKQTPVLPPPSSSFSSTLSLFPQLRAQSPPSKRCTTDGECLPATTPFFATVLGHCDQALGRCVRGPRQLCGPFTLCRPVNGLKTFCANAHCNVLV